MTDGAGGGGGTVRCSAEKLVLLPVDSLVPYEKNAKLHCDKQIKQLRASLREFGFVTPLLVDSANRVIAGHGRLLAAKAEHMTLVPCVLVSHLTEAQRRAYILADNRLAEGSSWDMALVDLELSGLAALDFDCKLTGFTPAPPETPVEKPHGTLRAPKTCTCPSCGCEFTPGKKK
ncbi:MAG: ParB/Srx family N-terminal domain-containing protein [Oscillospiraceae bacterium]